MGIWDPDSRGLEELCRVVYLKSTDIFEENIASIYMVKEQAGEERNQQEAGSKLTRIYIAWEKA